MDKGNKINLQAINIIIPFQIKLFHLNIKFILFDEAIYNAYNMLKYSPNKNLIRFWRRLLFIQLSFNCVQPGSTWLVTTGWTVDPEVPGLESSSLVLTSAPNEAQSILHRAYLRDPSYLALLIKKTV